MRSKAKRIMKQWSTSEVFEVLFAVYESNLMTSIRNRSCRGRPSRVNQLRRGMVNCFNFRMFILLFLRR